MMKVLLISTYELGRQPFGLASPAAWLGKAGFKVACLDLSREAFQDEAAGNAGLIAFYLPMHTATRLAIPILQRLRQTNPAAHICCYGLYAPMNEFYLRKLGVQTILGGEFEHGLQKLARRLQRGEGNAALQSEPVISLERQTFEIPDRSGLPRLEKYARLLRADGSLAITGYSEASRGCKHLCRHCPVVPVYRGNFRIISREVVMEDIRRQVKAGAEHITFGDPDFFNGTGHALPLVETLHREFPKLTYDVTIKVEHLVRHADDLPRLRDTGCLFVTSAIESVDDAVLEKLAKGHSRKDFLRVAAIFRNADMILQPTFVPFTPWTTLGGYLELLDVIEGEGLVGNTAPIQLAIRLLIPNGSLLLELPEIRDFLGPFDERALAYPWRNSDSRVDALAETLQEIVHASEKQGLVRPEIFESVRNAARDAAGLASAKGALPQPPLLSRAAIPYLTEPWYC